MLLSPARRDTSVTPAALTSSTGPAEGTSPVRRSYQQHLVAAQYFVDGAQAAGRDTLLATSSDALRHYHDLVAASVLSAAAFLEGSVNVLYGELQEGGLTHARRHSRRLHGRLSTEWRTHQRASTLQKYQLMLWLWDADPFHPQRSPCLEVDRLMRWRDSLVHRPAGPLYRIDVDAPACVPVGSVVHVEASHRPHARMGRLQLTSECAQWAVDSSINFSIEFCRRMRLPAREFGDGRGEAGGEIADGLSRSLHAPAREQSLRDVLVPYTPTSASHSR